MAEGILVHEPSHAENPVGIAQPQTHEMEVLELECALEAAEEQRDYLLKALDHIAGQRPTGKNAQRVLYMASIAAEAVSKERGPEPYTDDPSDGRASDRAPADAEPSTGRLDTPESPPKASRP